MRTTSPVDLFISPRPCSCISGPDSLGSPNLGREKDLIFSGHCLSASICSPLEVLNAACTCQEYHMRCLLKTTRWTHPQYIYWFKLSEETLQSYEYIYRSLLCESLHQQLFLSLLFLIDTQQCVYWLSDGKSCCLIQRAGKLRLGCDYSTRHASTGTVNNRISDASTWK